MSPAQWIGVAMAATALALVAADIAYAIKELIEQRKGWK